MFRHVVSLLFLIFFSSWSSCPHYYWHIYYLQTYLDIASLTLCCIHHLSLHTPFTPHYTPQHKHVSPPLQFPTASDLFLPYPLSIIVCRHSFPLYHCPKRTAPASYCILFTQYLSEPSAEAKGFCFGNSRSITHCPDQNNWWSCRRRSDGLFPVWGAKASVTATTLIPIKCEGFN